MAELSPAEKLQPSLIDRLRDREPDSTQESRERRVITMRKLREYVIRDLSWLLNTARLGIDQDLSDTPEVRTSVLNFGVPSLAGSSIDKDNLQSLEMDVKKAIINFEPRIDSRSLSVSIAVDSEVMGKHAMVFEIQGELWGNPIPTSLFLKTEIDLETGDVSVVQS